jgi:hypothetical protein
MQTETEIMLRNIKVVASLMPNDKLNTEAALFSIYVPTSMRGLWRFWEREHREANISRVQSCIRQAIVIIQTVLQTRDNADTFRARFQMTTEMQQCRRIMDALLEARIGLQNLAQTYRDDASAVAKLIMVDHEIEDFVHATQSAMQEHGTRWLDEHGNLPSAHSFLNRTG